MSRFYLLFSRKLSLEFQYEKAGKKLTQLDVLVTFAPPKKEESSPTINNRILNGYVAPDNAPFITVETSSLSCHYKANRYQTTTTQSPLSLSEKAKTCLLPALTNRTKVSSVLAILYLLLYHSPSNVFPSVLSETSSHQHHPR